MTKKERLDQFVRDICDEMKQYTSLGVEGTRIKQTDQYLLGKIEEATGGEAIELWSEDDEITFVYSQSHWHCNTYDHFTRTDSRPLEAVFDEIKQDILDIIHGKRVTYSAWQGEMALGSGDTDGTVEDAVREGANHFTRATAIHVKQWGKALVKIDVEQMSIAPE